MAEQDMLAVEKTVLKYINDNGEIKNTENFDIEQKFDKETFENCLKSLTAEEYIKLNVIERKEIELTDEGKSYAQNGSPEFQFVSNMVVGEVTSMATMDEKVGK